jgi:hypothetical protein
VSASGAVLPNGVGPTDQGDEEFLVETSDPDNEEPFYLRAYLLTQS